MSDLQRVAEQEFEGTRLPSDATWSSDGRRVYVVVDDIGDESSGISMYDTVEKRLHSLRVEGPIYAVAAF